MKTKFIVQLDEFTQKRIENDLKIFFKEELNLTNELIKVELKLAMSGRLVDLEDSLDLDKYLKSQI